jgi:hypothetical protein
MNEQERLKRMKDAVEAQKQKNQSEKVKAKRKAKETWWRRMKDGG